MDLPARIFKSALTNTPLYVYRMGNGSKEYTKRVLLHVDGFSKLKNNKDYVCHDFALDWNFIIRKIPEKRLVKVTIEGDGDFDRDSSCCCRYGNEGVIVGAFRPMSVHETRRPGENSTEWQISLSNAEDQDILFLGFVTNLEETPRTCCLAGKRTYTTERCRSVHEDDKLSESLAETHRENLLTDFEIKLADGISIPVHKAILAARSRFFRDYMQAEGSRGKDHPSSFALKAQVSYEAAKIVIDFIYTGKMQNDFNPPVMLDILYLAHKFNLAGLMHLAEDILLDNLEPEKLYAMNMLGRNYGLKKLLAQIAIVSTKKDK